MRDYYFTIKDMPEEMRPREKLLNQGETHLADSEILAIILGNGTHQLNAVELANQILIHYGSLRALKETTIEELMQIRGIGEAKAVAIKAALELGKRISLNVRSRLPMRTPEDVASAVMEEMRYFDREHFRVIYLDRKACLIAMEDVSVGGLHSSVAHPREVFKNACKRSAESMILVHNHPSGDPTPSQEDIDVTLQLIEAGKITNITILDHVIIGENNFCSLRRENLI